MLLSLYFPLHQLYTIICFSFFFSLVFLPPFFLGLRDISFLVIIFAWVSTESNLGVLNSSCTWEFSDNLKEHTDFWCLMQQNKAESLGVDLKGVDLGVDSQVISMYSQE